MKKIIFSILLLIIAADLLSQSYPFDSIPASLRSRADVVVRSEQCLYTIVNEHHAIERNKMVLTLLNERADPHRYVEVNYDKTKKVNFLRGMIYDEKGNIIKVLGLTDVQDISAVSGGTFYSDDRMKFLYFPLYKFPYTIEYEYEIEYSSIYSYVNWAFQNEPGMSVEKSGIQFIVPGEIPFRYLEENLGSKPDSVITSGSRIYTWQEENLPAVSVQNYAVTTHFPWPVLYTAPLNFEYGGIKGSLKSWKTYGEWMYSLIKGLDALPPEDLKKISGISAATRDKREIARMIYEYMQSRTRYVSIQIGIGGMRPSDASSVAKSGFGDCKGLVNYTMALMKAAGISSFYTLVKSGPDGKINSDFVIDQFDHIILCVPMQKDTVWLECTSQNLPFNYLGDFTDDRYVLLITPEGGKLTRTPSYGKYENAVRRTGTISLNNFGRSNARMSCSYSGINYFPASSAYGMASDEEIKRSLKDMLRYSDLEPGTVKFTETKSEKPSASLYYEAGINDFSTMTAKGMLFSPALQDAVYLQDIPMSIDISDNYVASDSITYNLPLGYQLDFKPRDVSIENEFGKFSCRIQPAGAKLIYNRYLEVNKGEISLEKFQEFRSFINEIAKTDNEIILLKN